MIDHKKRDYACIVIGSPERAKDVADVLTKAGLKTGAFSAQPQYRNGLLKVCANTSTKFVIVFGNGLEAGDSLIEELRKSNQGLIGIFVFVEVSERDSPQASELARRLLQKGVSNVWTAGQLTTEIIVATLHNGPIKKLSLPVGYGAGLTRKVQVMVRRGAEDLEEERAREALDSFPDDEIPEPSVHQVVVTPASPTFINRAGRRARGIFNREARGASPVVGQATPAGEPVRPEGRTVTLAVVPAVPFSVPRLSHGVVSEVVVQAATQATNPNDTNRWEPIIERVKRAMAKAQYMVVRPELIQPMEGQPRQFFDQLSLEELGDSIRSVGQFMPGMMRLLPEGLSKRYELLDGERRWRAVLLCGVLEYKAMLIEIDDEAAPYVIAAIANFHREDHTPLEISDAIERLHSGLGMPVRNIAKMFKISEIWAYKLHGLQKLHPRIRNLLDRHIPEKKRLQITVAIEVSKLDAVVQSQLVDAYQSKQVSLKGLRREALRIARESGTYIRRRDADEPARRLKTVRNAVHGLTRIADDLRDLLKEDGMGPIVCNESTALEGTLRDAEVTLAQCRGLIQTFQEVAA